MRFLRRLAATVEQEPPAPLTIDHETALLTGAALIPDLLADHDQARNLAAMASARYARLLAAVRAAIAAQAEGLPDPLCWVRDQLAEHGQLPPAGAVPVQ